MSKISKEAAIAAAKLDERKLHERQEADRHKYSYRIYDGRAWLFISGSPARPLTAKEIELYSKELGYE